MNFLRKGSWRAGLLAGTVMAAVGVASPVAHAITLPDFPTSPSRFEAPAGSTATGFIPMPGMCPNTGDVHGVFHGQIGKPVFEGTVHLVVHSGIKNPCTADAGIEVGVICECEFTGVVTTSLVIDAKDEAGGTASIGPHVIEFYMGVPLPVEEPESAPEPIPEFGGEAGPLALAALVTLAVGAALVLATRRRPLV
jgi:hypothetical protein